MRIVIYKAVKKVPFTTAYNQLGSPDKIVFSNHLEKISDFKKKDVDELKSLVKPFLPKQNFIGRLEEDTIFYVPFEIKEKFMEILENLINGFKKMMREGKENSIPTSEELGLGDGSSLASFYDRIEKQEVKVLMANREELIKLFNSIVEEDNEIDAVFVYSDKESLIVAKSDSLTDRAKRVNIEDFVGVLGGIATHKIRAHANRMGLGSLEYTIYQFSEGILNISLLEKDFKGKYLLCFVSANPEGKGLGEMLMYRRKNMDKIREQLLTLLA
jgi:hypothetical protein